MNEKKIEQQLKDYAAACEEILPREREARIAALLRIEPKPRTRGTVWDFILEQIGYLGRYCLFWQALWIALFSYLVQNGVPNFFGGERENEVLVMISLLPPILVLLTVEEITKVYQRSMLEIEYATKYSLQGIIMTRMSVLCAFHSTILCVCILILQARLDFWIGQLLVYGFTPMIVMTGALLKLMQHCQGELLRGAVFCIYALAVVLTLIGNTEYFRWFRPDYFMVWCVVCLAGLAFGIWQFVCLRRKLAGYEQIA